MCGRFQFVLLPDKKGRQIRERAEKLNLVFKEGEIFPDDRVLCIIPFENKIDLASMKWGIRNQSLQINARMESIADRPYYKDLKNNRCAIICNGFFEWDPERNKYFIHFQESYMYLAGIFSEDRELLIVTRPAPESFRSIHERIPLIMDQIEMLRYIHAEEDEIADKDLIIEPVDDELKLF